MDNNNNPLSSTSHFNIPAVTNASFHLAPFPHNQYLSTKILGGNPSWKATNSEREREHSFFKTTQLNKMDDPFLKGHPFAIETLNNGTRWYFCGVRGLIMGEWVRGGGGRGACLGLNVAEWELSPVPPFNLPMFSLTGWRWACAECP